MIKSIFFSNYKFVKRKIVIGVIITALLIIFPQISKFTFLPIFFTSLASKPFIYILLLIILLIILGSDLFRDAYIACKEKKPITNLLGLLAILLASTVVGIGTFNNINFFEYNFSAEAGIILILNYLLFVSLKIYSQRNNVDIKLQNKLTQKNIQRLNISGALFIAGALGAGLFWYYIYSDSLASSLNIIISILAAGVPLSFILGSGISFALYTQKAKNEKINIQNETTIEDLHDTHLAIFSKSAIMVENELKVSEIVSPQPKKLLSIALSLERRIKDPIARAIIEKANQDGIEQSSAQNCEKITGYGVIGQISSSNYAIGSMNLMNEVGVIVGILQREKTRLEKQGKTVILIGSVSKGGKFSKNPGKLIGMIALENKIKVGARALIKRLTQSGINCALLTGVSDYSARTLAKEIGFDESLVISQKIPAERGKAVMLLKSTLPENKKITMIGYGEEDLGAIVKADIGVIAREDARLAPGVDIAIRSSTAYDIGKIFNISDGVFSLSQMNYYLALSYNILVFIIIAFLFRALTTDIKYLPAIGAVLSFLGVWGIIGISLAVYNFSTRTKK